MVGIFSKSILITGGAGFIGSNLCTYFVEKSYNVICLDNFSTGHRSNINHLLKKDNFKLIEGDIRDLETCNRAVQNVDYVLHQAALGSVPRSILDPITTNDVNICGFLNMLVAAKNANIKRFVYAASSSVYGDSVKLPKLEDHIGKPLSPYAVSKLVNEIYADVFSKTYGLETIGLRYFNVFGPRQDPNGAYAAVIPKFIQQLIIGQSPIINGDGSFSRDFTYIDNVVQVNELAMTTNNPEAINKIYNVAFGAQNSINQLIDLLKIELSKANKSIKNIETIYGDVRTGDVPHSLASIEKAKLLLGYNPKISFQTGIQKTVQWFLNINNSKSQTK